MLGIGYPFETVDPGVVELYAIACGLKFALNFINNPTFSVSREGPIDTSFFRPGFMRTRSDMHKRKKELILFTDDVYALQRLNGTTRYEVRGAFASLVNTICDLSQLVAMQDIHLELHWSPGHSKIPGNEAAHDMARKAQEDLVSSSSKKYSKSKLGNHTVVKDEQQKECSVLGSTLSFAGSEVTGLFASPLNFPDHLSLPTRQGPSAVPITPVPVPAVNSTPSISNNLPQ